ncbi:MAG: acylneuraminate cytidylyltransferase family protein [Pseudomonadota bacterium]
MARAETPSVCAFILARAGSKGLPGKNVRPLAGKPLIAWSVEAALAAPRVTDVIVSTDGEDIAEAGRAAGAEVMMRPDALANDTALPKDAIRHHLDAMASAGRVPDIVMLLQPTSPLRAVDDLEDCLTRLIADGFDSAATFTGADTHPFQAFREVDGSPLGFVEGESPWRPRQALPPAYQLTGSVYAAWREPFLAEAGPGFLVGRAGMVVTPAQRAVDIDTIADFKMAEFMLAEAGD